MEIQFVHAIDYSVNYIGACLTQHQLLYLILHTSIVEMSRYVTAVFIVRAR